MGSLRDYLEKCPFFSKIQVEAAKNWTRIALQLASKSSRITGSWIENIEIQSNAPIGQAKAFLAAISEPDMNIDVLTFAHAVYAAGNQILALKIHPDASLKG